MTASEPSFLKEEGGRLRTELPEEHVEKIDEISDERGISRSQLLRQWIYAGWKAENSIELNIDSDASAESIESDPYRHIFINSLPESEEDAISLDDLKENILDNVENEVMRLYREYDGLSMSNGLVYKDE
jgi:hypothetical protein